MKETHPLVLLQLKAGLGEDPEELEALLDSHPKATALITKLGPSETTPLHTAVAFNNVESLRALLARLSESESDTPVGHSAAPGAVPPIDTPDGESGWTALHRACHWGRMRCAALLIQAGASLAARDSRGRTPVDLAARHLAPVRHLAFSVSDTASEPRCLTEVLTWGSGANYQLGTGSTDTMREVPAWVETLTGRSVKQVAASKFHSAAVTSSGALLIWGFGGPEGARLGHGPPDPNSRLQACIFPTPVGGPLGGRRVVGVAAAKHHTLCVTDDGEVFSFGSRGGDGRLGYPGVESQPTPRVVALGRGVRGVQVAAGNKHSAVLASTGAVYTFGSNQHCQLGYVTAPQEPPVQMTPRLVESIRGRVRHVSAAKRHTVVVTADGDVLTWGHHVLAPRRVALSGTRDTALQGGEARLHRGGGDVVRPKASVVAAGTAFTAVLTLDGTVLTWRSADPQLAVVEVGGALSGRRAVSISAGKHRCCAVSEEGLVYVWGDEHRDGKKKNGGAVGQAASSGTGQAAGPAAQGGAGPGARGEPQGGRSGKSSGGGGPGSAPIRPGGLSGLMAGAGPQLMGTSPRISGGLASYGGSYNASLAAGGHVEGSSPPRMAGFLGASPSGGLLGSSLTDGGAGGGAGLMGSFGGATPGATGAAALSLTGPVKPERVPAVRGAVAVAVGERHSVAIQAWALPAVRGRAGTARASKGAAGAAEESRAREGREGSSRGGQVGAPGGGWERSRSGSSSADDSDFEALVADYSENIRLYGDAGSAEDASSQGHRSGSGSARSGSPEEPLRVGLHGITSSRSAADPLGSTGPSVGPGAPSVPTLKALCEVAVAKAHINPKTAVQVYEYADALDSPWLAAAARAFIAANLDLVLAAAPYDMASLPEPLLEDLESGAAWLPPVLLGAAGRSGGGGGGGGGDGPQVGSSFGQGPGSMKYGHGVEASLVLTMNSWGGTRVPAGFFEAGPGFGGAWADSCHARSIRRRLDRLREAEAAAELQQKARLAAEIPFVEAALALVEGHEGKEPGAVLRALEALQGGRAAAEAAEKQGAVALDGRSPRVPIKPHQSSSESNGNSAAAAAAPPMTSVKGFDAAGSRGQDRALSSVPSAAKFSGPATATPASASTSGAAAPARSKPFDAARKGALSLFLRGELQPAGRKAAAAATPLDSAAAAAAVDRPSSGRTGWAVPSPAAATSALSAQLSSSTRAAVPSVAPASTVAASLPNASHGVGAEPPDVPSGAAPRMSLLEIQREEEARRMAPPLRAAGASAGAAPAPAQVAGGTGRASGGLSDAAPGPTPGPAQRPHAAKGHASSSAAVPGGSPAPAFAPTAAGRAQTSSSVSVGPSTGGSGGVDSREGSTPSRPAAAAKLPSGPLSLGDFLRGNAQPAPAAAKGPSTWTGWGAAPQPGAGAAGAGPSGAAAAAAVPGVGASGGPGSGPAPKAKAGRGGGGDASSKASVIPGATRAAKGSKPEGAASPVAPAAVDSAPSLRQILAEETAEAARKAQLQARAWSQAGAGSMTVTGVYGASPAGAGGASSSRWFQGFHGAAAPEPLREIIDEERERREAAERAEREREEKREAAKRAAKERRERQWEQAAAAAAQAAAAAAATAAAAAATALLPSGSGPAHPSESNGTPANGSRRPKKQASEAGRTAHGGPASGTSRGPAKHKGSRPAAATAPSPLEATEDSIADAAAPEGSAPRAARRRGPRGPRGGADRPPSDADAGAGAGTSGTASSSSVPPSDPAAAVAPSQGGGTKEKRPRAPRQHRTPGEGRQLQGQAGQGGEKVDRVPA